MAPIYIAVKDKHKKVVLKLKLSRKLLNALAQLKESGCQLVR
jgi:hypothetical protein